MPPAHPSHRLPASSIAFAIDRTRVDALLTPWVPDAADRAFVLRCMLDEGPIHHRGASFVLLSLLGRVLDRLPADADVASTTGVAVPLRVPPHLRGADDQDFPLCIPIAPLEEVTTDHSQLAAMVDCLTDGPAHHALANAAMVCLLGEVLRRLEARGR